MNVVQTYASLRQRLTRIAGAEGEGTAMARLIFHALKGWDTTALVIHGADEVSDFTRHRIEEIVSRLETGEPIQYILGETYFYGMMLKVDSSTLIPRPETEELVDMIVDDCRGRRDLRVLDIGTGSGAIAIALSRNLEFPEVAALDMSAAALSVARDNAARLHADINFIEADIFSYNPAPRSLDIIVSNPPYVMESERASMERHVLDHEPATALFVPDADPLRFYRRIAEAGLTALDDGGRLYFEINPLCADSLRGLLTDAGYADVQLHLDERRKQRFATCRLQAGSSR